MAPKQDQPTRDRDLKINLLLPPSPTVWEDSIEILNAPRFFRVSPAAYRRVPLLLRCMLVFSSSLPNSLSLLTLGSPPEQCICTQIFVKVLFQGNPNSRPTQRRKDANTDTRMRTCTNVHSAPRTQQHLLLNLAVI